MSGTRSDARKARESTRWGVRPSNGTEGDIQRADTCDRCVIDHAYGWHDGREDGPSCPIIIDALVGEHSYPSEDGPPQWGQTPDGEFVCANFIGPCACESQSPLAVIARTERRREVTQQALEAIMSGADFTDADAFLDQLEDRGASVVIP